MNNESNQIGPDISFFVPCYNEEQNIAKTLGKIISSVNKTPLSYEIIVVNDKSEDQTKEAIACFQRTLETDPHHEKAQSALRSFIALEENPNLASYDDFSDDGTLLIPFVENASSTEGAISQSILQPIQSAPVRQAAFRQPLSNNRNAGVETRALQDRARSMMHHRMERNKRVAEQ